MFWGKGEWNSPKSPRLAHGGRRSRKAGAGAGAGAPKNRGSHPHLRLRPGRHQPWRSPA